MMQCVAIDDEPLALDVIEKYVSRIPDLKLAGRFTRAMDAFDLLNKNAPDLLFLDIRMPGVTGIEFLKSLPDRPMVIFTTAYENYALEGYELDVVDYLLKPIPFDRFVKAVNKARDLHQLRKAMKSQEGQEPNFIFVRSEYQLIRINLNDILYIEGLKDYVKIFTGPGRPVLSHQNLKTIEGKLPAGRFLRVHKSFIVPVNKIEAVQKNTLKVGDAAIPVGESYKEELHRIINEKGKY